ncbi:Periplasmic dipeptide transport protein [invertebrate metagenome]|uniref:Periplasmic dipeptide transport protein n=1 Tax=invertebrate metagenome TaxID=1711999 RepID=A0A2H9T6S7_9ZZZZ
MIIKTAHLARCLGAIFLAAVIHSGYGNATQTVTSHQQITVSHGIARFDDLKYPENFSHFDYVNPNAPKGGHLQLFAHGTFDSLNPYAITGITPSGLDTYSYMRFGFSEINEPLMVGTGFYAPSGDEPMSAYGLIAQSVEYPPENQWIIFHLRPEARFHDGHPITASDVAFSFHTLKTKGHPRYKMQLEPISDVNVLNTHSVKFIFKKPGSRTQLFRAAELPVIPDHYWKTRHLEKSSLTPPVNSGPYQITQVNPGKSIVFERRKDYWGKHLPVSQGFNNFDKITLFFYRDLSVAFESFKAGGHDLHVEIMAKNWKTAYDFPAVLRGDIKQQELKRRMVYGSSFLYFNTRLAVFSDRRVREALGYLFNYEWTNHAIFHDMYNRASSYFPNTLLASSGLPSEKEQAVLQPWKTTLSPDIFNKPFSVPQHSTSEGMTQNNKRKALALLRSAGWDVHRGQMRHKITQNPLRFDMIHHSQAATRYLLPFKNNLAALGIDMSIHIMDASQYYRRLRKFDFGMIEKVLPHMHYPDLEPERYFHSQQADLEGSYNFSGIRHPAIDALVEKIPQTTNKTELITLTRSLDRILLSEHYGIPKWYSHTIRVAHKNKFAWPAHPPDYITGFNTWWIKPTAESE